MALHKRPKAGNWQATGSKYNKKLFIAGLVKEGYGAFEGKESVMIMLLDGSYIKNIDFNREHTVGEFLISSEWPDDARDTINLDNGDINAHINYALTGVHSL